MLSFSGVTICSEPVEGLLGVEHNTMRAVHNWVSANQAKASRPPNRWLVSERFNLAFECLTLQRTEHHLCSQRMYSRASVSLVSG